MNIGIVIEETWAFFKEIYGELANHHGINLFTERKVQTPIFRERLNQFIYSRDLKALLRSSDVVFFEWASEALVDATQLPKIGRIVTRLHRYELYRHAERIDWEKVDRIILVSQAKREEFIRLFPHFAQKIVVIPEAVSLTKFSTKKKEFSGDIGILCNLTPRKRVYELILAFHVLNQQNKKLHLHVGGGKHPLFGDYYEAVHSLVNKLNLQDNITFYGNVKEPEKWYSHIDIFISNSYSEGLQVSPLEAIASGCYCIGHRWDGAEELFPQNNLYYTEGELVEKVLNYCSLTQSEKQEKTSELRAIVVENFDIDKTKLMIRKLLEEVSTLPVLS